MPPQTRRSVQGSTEDNSQKISNKKNKLNNRDIEQLLDNKSYTSDDKSAVGGKNSNTNNDNSNGGIRMTIKKLTSNDQTIYKITTDTGDKEEQEKYRRSKRKSCQLYPSLNDEALSQNFKELPKKCSLIHSTLPRDSKHKVCNSSDEENENKMWHANKNNKSRNRILKPVFESSEHETPKKKQKSANEVPCTPLKNLSLNSVKKSSNKKLFDIDTTPKRTPKNSIKDLKREVKPRKSKKNIQFSDFNSEDDDDDDKDPDFRGSQDSESDESHISSDESHTSSDEFNTSSDEWNVRQSRNYKSKKLITPSKLNTPSKVNRRKTLTLTPSMHKNIRTIKIAKPSTPLQEARSKLHVSVLPKSLPCREEQFNDIYTFLHGRLADSSGGCIYISGVPGTGKTATVNEVIRCLKKAVANNKLPEFELVEINGMKLSEPRQAYVQIWKQLSGESKTWEAAQKLLQNRFTKSGSSRKITLLLVDELDLLCTKRQDVVYNLLDWPTKTNANLVVITIANTMDLPERIFMGRVTSRLGLTRLSFPTYNFKQLEEIVSSRMRGFDAFCNESIQLVARKVASLSGDARRCLDICRRATEVAEMNQREVVTMDDVKQALNEMISSPKIKAIQHCSDMEKVFLQAVCQEISRSGLEEVIFKNVYNHVVTLLRIDAKEVFNVSEALDICNRLGSHRLLICEHSKRDIHQRILLNVSTDDVYFAIRNA